MPPEIGACIGPYLLVSPLGAGGMGQVYRARDTRLGRDVAVKVLVPEAFGVQASARFQREVAIAAKLAHPRICTLLDAGADHERLYFVMELVEGETLATHLARAGTRGLPEAEALDIAAGLCEALAFAHRHGVVHRDVKPANIMLTRNGVKLLDFGIAHVTCPDVFPQAMADTAALGVIGTPAYMAPEQLDGRADARSDLFSLGTVLYEMLTGHRAFDGDTSADVLAAVVRCAPEPLALAAGAPSPMARQIVSRCLQRNPDERWQSAADLCEALRWAQGGIVPTTIAKSRARQWRRWAWAALVVAALAMGWPWLVGRGRSVSSEAFYLDDIALPDGQRFLTGQSAWSHDGRHVAVVLQSVTDGDVTLWTRDVGVSVDWQLLDGTGPESVAYPSWSPDGTSLAYFRDHKLVRLSLPSSTPLMLADAPDGRGTTWLDETTVVYAPDAQGDIWQVAATGGAPRVLVRRQGDDLAAKYPVVVGDRQVMYWAQRAVLEHSEIRVAMADIDGTRHVVAQSSKAGAYADGQLYYVQGNRLVAQPVNARSWTLFGRAAPLPVETGGGGNIGAPFAAAGGHNVGVESLRRETRELTWVDRQGRPLGTIGEPAASRTVSLSPSGGQVLVDRAAPGVDMASIWLLDLSSGASRRLATEVGASLPVWSAHQDRVAFRASIGPGGSGAVRAQALSSSTGETLVEVLASARPAGWTPDGDLLWWAGDATGRFNGIFMRSLDHRDRVYRTVRVGADIGTVALAPDGTRIAYTSNESGAFEVYVDAFPTPGSSPRRISTGGGTLPKWRRDGREVFFVSDNALHAVAMRGVAVGMTPQPVRLFAFDGSDYDVHPDGRFLTQRRRHAEVQYLRVFRNWAMR